MMQALVFALPVLFIVLALVKPPPFRPYERLRKRRVSDGQP